MRFSRIFLRNLIFQYFRKKGKFLPLTTKIYTPDVEVVNFGLLLLK